jgi:hypothetical protein
MELDVRLPNKPLLTVAEVSDHLRCTPRHVRDLVKAGALNGTDVSLPESLRPDMRIERSSVIQFISDGNAKLQKIFMECRE